jgi:predicted nuclease with RNAse H fold
MNARYAGIDVGGRRKGFHAAAVAATEVVAGPQRLATVEAVLQWLDALEPSVVALDSPMTCAPPGQASRAGERKLAKEICGIRWTPDETKLEGNPYYEWIVCGRELYAALDRERPRTGWAVIEVFPTASWTVWAGPRGSLGQARWTRQALESMALGGLPPRRLNQDDRDAIAAAITARLHAEGRSRSFGEIVVPTSSRSRRTP